MNVMFLYLKNMNKNKKNIILIIIVLVVLVGVARLLFFKDKTTERNPPKKEQETAFEMINQINNIDKVSPKSIVFALQKEMVLDKKMAVYTINNRKIDDVLADKIAKSFYFEKEAEINEETLIVYTNQENNTQLDINKQTLTVKFSKNLLLSPIIKPIKTITVEEIVEKLENLMVENFNLEPDIKIKTERIEYEDLAGPRFVVSTKEKSRIVKVVSSYEINGFPVLSLSGFPVIARFATDGNLLNLSVKLPFNNVVKQSDFSIKTESELKNTPFVDYQIMDVDGGKEHDLSSIEETVSEVNLTSGYLGYVFTPGSDYLSPYIFFKGNSKLPSGPAVVVVAVPALKEDEYYK